MSKKRPFPFFADPSSHEDEASSRTCRRKIPYQSKDALPRRNADGFVVRAQSDKCTGPSQWVFKAAVVGIEHWQLLLLKLRPRLPHCNFLFAETVSSPCLI